MDTAVVAEVAFALTRAGHATLRFNYRGVGASQGTPAGIDEDVEDLEAARVHLMDTAGPRIALCGVGHGALAVLRLAARGRKVESVVLIAPLDAGPDLLGATTALAQCAGGAPRVLWIDVGADGAGEAKYPDWLAPLGSTVQRSVVDGADRGFLRGLPKVGRLVAGFIGSTGLQASD